MQPSWISAQCGGSLVDWLQWWQVTSWFTGENRESQQDGMGSLGHWANLNWGVPCRPLRRGNRYSMAPGLQFQVHPCENWDSGICMVPTSLGMGRSYFPSCKPVDLHAFIIIHNHSYVHLRVESDGVPFSNEHFGEITTWSIRTRLGKNRATA